MIDPVVCDVCGEIRDAAQHKSPICESERIGRFFGGPPPPGNVWSCGGELRPLPEPHDPDLGALHGVTTCGSAITYTQMEGGEPIPVRLDGAIYAGPHGCAVYDDDIDPTGEHAFLRAVGEE